MKNSKHNREFGIGERVVVNEKAPGGYVGRSGTIREVVLDSRYGISFNNHKEPITYLDSECLNRVQGQGSSANDGGRTT